MVEKPIDKYRVLGLMSGTSLDGLDMVLCCFTFNNSWEYKVEKAKTISYSQELISLLRNAAFLKAEKLIELDHFYGKWLGRECIKFLQRENQPHFISSHGHTIFHQPEKDFTLQIGNGNDIAAISKLPVVYDFRSLDIALGGQGAPLVPAGDELLFSKYGYCLNLGGFANISYRDSNKRFAFDICPVNIVLNDICSRINKPFDKFGETGRKGKILKNLLHTLNSIGFYKLSPPRSLSREWYESTIRRLLKSDEDPANLLRTLYEHITDQIAEIVNINSGKNILITGGGAKNLFLIELLSNKCKNEIIVPDKITVDFKEAIIFAFLGLLRIRNEVNCYSSVTGAQRDSSSGVIVNQWNHI